MKSIYEFVIHLKSIIKLLQEEKQTLIHSDGHKIEEIIKRKNKLIDKLPEFKGIDIENNQKVMNLIEEINSLQEVNLLLTKQALAFQNTLLESIAINVKSMSNTYSAKGNYEASSPVSLVNQSV